MLLVVQGKILSLFIFIGRNIYEGMHTIFSYSVDSIMLVEEGFDVVSVDASDKMLKYALKERWNRRNEKQFDKWGLNINIFS